MQTTTAIPERQATVTVGAKGKFWLPADLGLVLILGTLGFLTFVPVLMLLQLSFKTEQQMADAMWLPILPLHFENYLRAGSVMVSPITNSVIFVLGTVSLSIVCSTMSSYMLARYSFPGKHLLFIAILGLMMIPGILTLLTRFSVTLWLGLNNTFWGVWLPMAAGAQAFQVIVLRTFFESIPEEYFEAARIDGASEFRMITTIALPLAKPILTTLIVLQIDGVWNEYVWPIMVLSDPRLYPVMLAILGLDVQLLGISDPGAKFAGFALAGLPMMLLFALTSRAFIRGLTSGALKM